MSVDVKTAVTSCDVLTDTWVLLDESKVKQDFGDGLKAGVMDVKDSFAFSVEAKDFMVDGLTSNQLVNAMLYAYNTHVAMRWRPDDLLLCIAMTVSTYVAKNAEAVRDVLVSHKGVKKLQVELEVCDWNLFLKRMTELVHVTCKDPPSGKIKLSEALTSSFTTTTAVSGAVSQLSVLSTFSPYCSYSFMLGCGYPAMVLEGSLKDWELLKSKYVAVKQSLPGLQWWYTQMDVIIDLFLDMKKLGYGQVKGTADMKLLWSKAITMVPQGSGGQQFLGGWIHMLFPLDSNGGAIFKSLDVYPPLDVKQPSPERGQHSHYGYQGVLKDFFKIRGWNSVPSGLFKVDAEFITPLQKDQISIVAGFYGMTIHPKDHSVKPVLGWNIKPFYEIKKDRTDDE